LDWAKAEQEIIAAKAINKEIFFIATCLFFKGFELIGRKHRKEEIYIQVFISQQIDKEQNYSKWCGLVRSTIRRPKGKKMKAGQCPARKLYKWDNAGY
jgi:hypothetical protein